MSHPSAPIPAPGGVTGGDQGDQTTEGEDVKMPHVEGLTKDSEAAEEWITWKFTEEEEARRRAYLPLA